MNREVHVRIWERPEVRALRAIRPEDTFPRPRLSACYAIREKTFAGTHGNGRDAPISAVRRVERAIGNGGSISITRRSRICVVLSKGWALSNF
jgi:hypothetical protein